MKNLVILVEFFVIFSTMTVEAFTKTQLLGCKQWGPEKNYECKTVTPGIFEIGDNQTWKDLVDAKKFRFESRAPGTPSAFVFKSENMFKYFPNLKQLAIAAENVTFPYDVIINEEKLSNMRENLFNQPGLEALWLEGGGINLRHHFWKLPSSLTALTLIRQNYASYDLEHLFDLQNLTIWGSALHKMPRMARITPPLVRLNLSNNPLYDFSVDDIAPFCHLEYLSFDYSTMGSRFRNCECKRLKKWIEYLKTDEQFLFEGKFICGKDLSDEECSDYNLNWAHAERDMCLHKFTGGSGGSDEADDYLEQILLTDSKKLSHNSPTAFLVMAVFVMIVLITLSSAGAYIYINFIRRDANSNTSVQNVANANQQQQPQPQAQAQPQPQLQPQQPSSN